MTIDTTAWHEAGHIDDMTDGVLGTLIAGIPVALYLVDDALYATHDLCTHGNARLSDGWLDGGVIECPLHQGLFDVRTGAAVGPPCTRPVHCFKARLEPDGRLLVQV